MLLLQVFFNLMFVPVSILLRHFNVWFLLIIIHLPPPLPQLLHYLIKLCYPLLYHLGSLLSYKYDIRCEYPLRWIVSLLPHHSLLLLNLNGRICGHRVHLLEIPLPVPPRHLLILLSLVVTEEPPLRTYLLHLLCLVLPPPGLLLEGVGGDMGFLEESKASFS
jgi:hypothetical protein